MKINFELNSSSVVGWFKKYWWALAVPSVFAGVMYFAWTPNPTQGLSDPAEVERQLNGDFTPHSQIKSSLHQPPAAKQEFAEVEVTGTVADGRVHAVVKVPKSNGGGGLIADQSDLVKTETWMQSIVGGMGAVLESPAVHYHGLGVVVLQPPQPGRGKRADGRACACRSAFRVSLCRAVRQE
jgi:hypothetical protein